jgi:3-methyl-2-oxobutanoate hydroxymethyltransferase
VPKAVAKITAPGLKALKKQGQKIVTLTCYDFSTAQVLNNAGVDVLLVGDSLGMVKLGYPTTLPVTVEDMAYHTRIVARGNTRALLVTDMPYLSYHVSPEQAVENCGRMLKEGAEAVKIEGGSEIVPVIAALRRAKIPVMGHLGMTPQSVNVFGGYKVQGRDKQAIKQLVSDAKALDKAGVFAIVLECLPPDVARAITRAVSIPTIGIGAGVGCDGQVLVIDDLLGWTDDPLPRFVKRYAHLRETVRQAVEQYGRDVRSGKFPDAGHSYT